jgi:hypothetical protein
MVGMRVGLKQNLEVGMTKFDCHRRYVHSTGGGHLENISQICHSIAHAGHMQTPRNTHVDFGVTHSYHTISTQGQRIINTTPMLRLYPPELEVAGSNPAGRIEDAPVANPSSPTPLRSSTGAEGEGRLSRRLSAPP